MKRLLALLLVIQLSGLIPANTTSVLTPAAYASGSQLANARKKFSQGDIVAAHDLLKKNVARLGTSDKIEAYKLLGICAYLMGRKSEAESAFRTALQLSPNTKLNPRDVLDPAINAVFDGLKRSVDAQPTTANSALKSLPRQAPAGQSKKTVSTVTVQANAPGATVFANGLFVGTAGSPIELSPGTYKLTISAAGYNASSKTVTVGKGQSQTVNVTLVDPIEVRKQQLLEARKRRLAEEAEERQRRIQAAADARAREEERKRALEAELEARRIAEAEERAREEARLKALTAQRVAEELVRQREAEARRKEDEERRRQLAAQIAARKKAEAELRELERQEAEAVARSRGLDIKPAAKPRRPNQGLDYTSDLPSGSRSLADEFKRDQSSPPPAAYPQQPPAAYPVQPNYQQPPAQAYQTPPQRSAYTTRYPQTRKRQRSADKSTFLAFMPFGIGQFQNDDYGLGTASALAQVAALGFGIFEYTLVEAQQRTFEEWAAANPQPSGSDSQAYVDETQAYLDQHRQLMAIGFISFGAIWLVSGIEALISINSNSIGYASTWEPSPTPRLTSEQDTTTIKPFATIDGAFGLEISTSLR